MFLSNLITGKEIFKMSRRTYFFLTVSQFPRNDDHLYRDPDYPWDAYLQS